MSDSPLTSPQEPEFETLYCANHPQRETMLRCNRCDKPICAQCAILTPTGYRCRECVRGQQKKFETTMSLDYPIAAVVAAVIAFAGSYLANIFIWFIIIIAPIVGIIIDEAVRWAVRRRRSPLLTTVTIVAAVVGGLVTAVIDLVTMFPFITSGIPIAGGFFLSLIWRGVYTALVAGSLYTRLRGIIRR